MGIILSRVRKKKSAIETLEKLDKDIKEIEQNRVNTQRKYKKITKLLLIYSVGLYILCGLIFYFQFTSTIKGKLLYLVPLAISPLLLYIIRRIISWYFNRVIAKNQIRLNEMKKEKKKILDEVMDKETYKVAKEILEKFSEPVPKINYNLQLAQASKLDSVVRRRVISPTASAPAAHQPPNNGLWNPNQAARPVTSNIVGSRPLPAPGTPALRLPAPILPLNRSYVDRVVEYLIGDGPNNRYALICSQCHSHNGMALKEEFEYIGFICCYCRFFNPARKVKPEAPKLELRQSSDSDSDKTSGEDSDEEHKEASGETISSDVLQTSSADFEKEVESKANELAENESINDESRVVAHLENTGVAEVGNSTEDAEVRSSTEDAEVRNSTEEHISTDQPDSSNANCDESLVKS